MTAKKSARKPRAKTPATPVKSAVSPGKPAQARGIPLKTIAQARRELARAYRDARAGRMTPASLRHFSGAIGVLHKLIEGDMLERRISALEARAAALSQGRQIA